MSHALANIEYTDFQFSDSHAISSRSIIEAEDESSMRMRLLNYFLQAERQQETFSHEQSRLTLASMIQSFKELPEDWDGDGALRISEQSINVAGGLIANIPQHISLPEIEPNSNGTISFYWDWDNGRAEIEIGKKFFSWVIFVMNDGKKDAINSSGDIANIGNDIAFRFLPTLEEATDPVHNLGQFTSVTNLSLDWGDSIFAR